MVDNVILIWLSDEMQVLLYDGTYVTGADNICKTGLKCKAFENSRAEQRHR